LPPPAAVIRHLHLYPAYTLLQGYDAGSKEYSIVLASNQEVVKHTLEGALWRQLKGNAAARGTPAAAAAAGVGQVGGDKESLVGHRIEVWWPGEKAWFGGKVMVRASCEGTGVGVSGGSEGGVAGLCHGCCWAVKEGLYEGCAAGQ
jgi:hypothetical protein